MLTFGNVFSNLGICGLPFRAAAFIVRYRGSTKTAKTAKTAQTAKLASDVDWPLSRRLAREVRITRALCGIFPRIDDRLHVMSIRCTIIS